MKRFFRFVFKLLINTVTTIAFIALTFIIFNYFILKSNYTSLENIVSYIQAPENNTSIGTIPNIDSINITIDDNNEDNIPKTSSNNKFYYSQLDSNAKIIYDGIENNISNLTENNYIIDFSTKFNNLLNNSDNGKHILDIAFQSALDAFFYDHPELFYIDLTKLSLTIRASTFGPKTTYTVSIAPVEDNYLCESFESKLEVDESIKKVEKIRDTIVNNLPNTDDYSDIRKIHDMLVNSLEYDSTLNRTNTHNIYGALIEKTVVCEGYAKAFKYLLDSIGIECILVNGTATNSEGETEAHMWNYIKLDNNWYGVDVTWDDPIIIGGISSNIIRHDYFCKGKNIFDKSHVISNKISDKGISYSIPNLSYEDYK